MLTKSDISAIKKVVQTETREIVQSETRKIVQEELVPVKNDVQKLTNRIGKLETRVTRVHKDLKKEIKTVSHVLDKENIKTSKRVNRIEEHLGIAQA